MDQLGLWTAAVWERWRQSSFHDYSASRIHFGRAWASNRAVSRSLCLYTLYPQPPSWTFCPSAYNLKENGCDGSVWRKEGARLNVRRIEFNKFGRTCAHFGIAVVASHISFRVATKKFVSPCRENKHLKVRSGECFREISEDSRTRCSEETDDNCIQVRKAVSLVQLKDNSVTDLGPSNARTEHATSALINGRLHGARKPHFA